MSRLSQRLSENKVVNSRITIEEWRGPRETQQEIMSEFEHLLRYEQSCSELTIGSYTRALLKFHDFLQDSLEAKSLLDINTEDIGRFLVELRNKKNCANTITSYISAFRKFYGWATYKHDRENLPRLNFYLNNMVKTPRGRIIPFMPTVEHIEKLRETLKAHKAIYSYDTKSRNYRKTMEAYAVIELLITSGMRSQEVRLLCREDIDLEKNIVIVRHPKGNRQRISLFGESARDILKEYFELNNFNPKDLIFQLKNGNGLHYVIKRWAERAGIDPRIHSHSFRHYFITQSQIKGIPVQIVAAQVGHNDLRITQHYSHFDTHFIQEKYGEVKI